MKLYFCKYLPINDEIKEVNGTKIINLNNNKVFTYLSNSWRSSSHATSIEKSYLNSGAYKLLKLFLCSRNIQIGDKLKRWDGDSEELIELEFSNHTWLKMYPEKTKEDYIEYLKKANTNCFKVIGEISPDATWIKENDEFDLEELCFTYKPHDTIEKGIVLIKDKHGNFY
jgi:hypothetical protein